MGGRSRIKLTDKQLVAVGTMAFEFERPPGFAFVAGQFADFTLVDPPEMDDEGATRTFSLAGAPDEPGLLVATRLRDTAFKRVLRDLPEGAEVVLDGPYGGFTLPEETDRPVVFLTGGIGITPVRSMLLDAARRRTGHTLTLFYANNRTQDAAFLDELIKLGQDTPAITVVPTIARPEVSDRTWTGETGFIDAAMLRRHLPSLTGPVYYLCGPAAMVTAMRRLLEDAGVDFDDIETEEFSGY